MDEGVLEDIGVQMVEGFVSRDLFGRTGVKATARLVLMKELYEALGCKLVEGFVCQ